MYYKRSFWLLAASLICSKSVDSHPAFEDAGQLRIRREVSEDEGPSPEYLIGSILSHKAVTGLLGSLVDVPVRQAIQEEDPDSPWASFDFGGLVGLGLQMGGRALQGEENLLQGRDTAQQLAGVLSKFPKSRRELAMEARQAQRDKLAAETKTKRDDHDYDDLQDIGMRRGSRFGEKHSKEKRTEAFGLATPSRTTASQPKWEVADDYDDVQDVASSSGRQSKAKRDDHDYDDLQDISMRRGSRFGEKHSKEKRTEAFGLATPSRTTASQPKWEVADDYDDVQDVASSGGRQSKAKRDDHDYDDLQDISMRRGSRFGEKHSKEKRTEAFGLATPSRTTASQPKWEVADDYDDVQDVASSSGRQSKAKRDDHDYDDLQDISMRRGSRFGEKHSKEKRTEAFGLATPSRTTASQPKWEVADDYDDVQDVASSSGRQSKAGEMERNKPSALATLAPLLGPKTVKTIDDDYDDIQDIGIGTSQGSNPGVSNEQSFEDTDLIDDDIQDVEQTLSHNWRSKTRKTQETKVEDDLPLTATSDQDTQDVVDTYSTGSSRPVDENSNQHEYGTGRKESKLLFNSCGTERGEPSLCQPVQPHNDASYNVRETKAFDSQPGYKRREYHDSNSGFFSEREIERSYDSNKYGGKRKLSPENHLAGVANADRGIDASHNKGGGPSLREQWHYKRRKSPMAHEGRYEREEDDGELGFQPIGFNSFNPDRLGLPRNGRRRSHVYDNYNSEESDFKRIWRPQERSSLDYIEHERHNDGEDWPRRAENYDENDNSDYDDEESGFSSSTENQQYNQRWQLHEDNRYGYDGYGYDSRREPHYGHDNGLGATPFPLYKPRTPYPYSRLYRQQDNGYRSDSYRETRHYG